MLIQQRILKSHLTMNTIITTISCRSRSNFSPKRALEGCVMSGLSEAVLSQIHLSGEVDCPHFKPHMLKANLCVECSKLISKHSPAAIPDDDCLLRAIEFSQKGEKVPSCIFPRQDGRGGLYHGGFKAVMNTEFLQKENITHIVNTAKGLEMFGPKYLSAVERAKSSGVSILNLDWEDTEQYKVSYDDLGRSSQFIHTGRLGGGSVLVHCAQGKSRSSLAVISYLLAIERGTSFEECARMVKEQRKMAEPNPAFTRLLVEYSRSDTLKQLQQELIDA